MPLGGYVSLAGEQPDDEDSDAGWPEDQLFMSRPPLQRLIVVLAGPVANFILAWLIYWVMFIGLGHVPTFEYQVEKVLDHTPAMAAGIVPGDVITRIDGDIPYTPGTLSNSILFAQDDPVEFTVRRDDKTFSVTITPAFLTEEDKNDEMIPRPKIGVQFATIGAESPLGSLLGAGAALDKCGDTIAETARTMYLLLSGKASHKAVGGPIMIVEAVGASAQNGLLDVLLLAAFISVNLGLLNLLPIPVLDGGHIAFFTYELIRGRAVNDEFRRFATYVGISLLMGLMLLAFYNDFYRLYQRFFA